MEGEEYRAIMQAWDDLADGIPRGMAMEEAIPSSTTWYCRFLPFLFLHHHALSDNPRFPSHAISA